MHIRSSCLMERNIVLSLCLLSSSFITSAVTNDPTYNYPAYYVTRTIDDVTLYWYDSVGSVVERRVPWFKGPGGSLMDASFLEVQIQRNMQRLLLSLMLHLNESSTFPVLQLLDGCTTSDDGTPHAVLSYRYNGEPFLTFSVEEGEWTAEVEEAQFYADVNNENETRTEMIRDRLGHVCISHIQELLPMGSCTLSRRERPVVKVKQTPITNCTCRLHCLAYGHYPKDINMTWYRNRQQVSEDLMDRVTLPFPDITYLTWLSLNISVSPDDVYTCSVTHSSMMAPFTEDWRPTMDSEELSRTISTGGVIAICLAVVLLVTVIIFVSISLAKERQQ
ncbi:major histocompatibility complex class I-related gene protein-like isoform X2 [Hyperolius riggenbachi]|uniref:major histocompatibility complex class I-related gene protein-like isoform X2 n=1 Tax=Hyperolius riggenbachi TaxID=752182 RepID=UPI0035A38334